jgi:hypothetical protein
LLLRGRRLLPEHHDGAGWSRAAPLWLLQELVLLQLLRRRHALLLLLRLHPAAGADGAADRAAWVLHAAGR